MVPHSVKTVFDKFPLVKYPAAALPNSQNKKSEVVVINPKNNYKSDVNSNSNSPIQKLSINLYVSTPIEKSSTNSNPRECALEALYIIAGYTVRKVHVSPHASPDGLLPFILYTSVTSLSEDDNNDNNNNTNTNINNNINNNSSKVILNGVKPDPATIRQLIGVVTQSSAYSVSTLADAIYIVLIENVLFNAWRETQLSIEGKKLQEESENNNKIQDWQIQEAVKCLLTVLKRFHNDDNNNSNKGNTVDSLNKDNNSTPDTPSNDKTYSTYLSIVDAYVYGAVKAINALSDEKATHLKSLILPLVSYAEKTAFSLGLDF